MNGKLSERDYWNGVLEGAKLPRLNDAKDYHLSVTMDYIHEELAKKNSGKFLEVGCGSSGWLPFFANKYNFDISGIDYSEIGCYIAEKNLEMQCIAYNEIVCADITTLEAKKKYDIVFSYGLVEHFDNYPEIIGLLGKFLKSDGILITVIPNINGVNKFISSYFMPAVHNMHKIINIDEIKGAHSEHGMYEVKADYVGNFTLACFAWVRAEKFPFSNRFTRRLALYSVSQMQRLLDLLNKVFNFGLVGKYCSPYIISIYKNK